MKDSKKVLILCNLIVIIFLLTSSFIFILFSLQSDSKSFYNNYKSISNKDSFSLTNLNNFNEFILNNKSSNNESIFDINEDLFYIVSVIVQASFAFGLSGLYSNKIILKLGVY